MLSVKLQNIFYLLRFFLSSRHALFAIGYLQKLKWGIGERNEGNDGNMGNLDWNAGNQGGNAENEGENAGNQGGNLRIGVELMN